MDARQRYREVLAINRAIAGAQDYGEVLRLVVEKTAAFTGAAACMLLLAQEDGLARVVRSVGVDPAKAAQLTVRLTERIDLELCVLLGCRAMGRFLGVPVIGKEGLLGVLAVCWPGATGLDGADDDELLSALADQAAIALDNAERVRRLHASTEALRASTERFRDLAETTSDWLWEVDENAVYTYASPRVRELLGYEPEEVLGRTPFDLMPPGEARRVGEVFADITGERRAFASLENTNRHRDGHLVVLETSGIPLFDGAGGFRGYRGIDRDITERKRVEQALRDSEAKLAGLISIAADAIISIDQAQRIVMFNHGAEEVFGWSRDEVLGKPLDLLLPERFRWFHSRHIAGYGAGFDPPRKMQLCQFGLRKSGEEFPVEGAISKLHDAGGWMYTVVLRDITDQKRREHEEQFLAEVGRVLAASLDSENTLTSVAELAMRDNADFCAIDLVDELGELRRVKAAGSDPTKAAIYEALMRFPSHAVVESMKPGILAEIAADALRAMAQSEEHRRLLEALAPTSAMEVPLIAHGRLLGALSVASCRPGRRYRASDLRLLAQLAERAAAALENARLYRLTRQAVQTRDEVLGIVAHDLRNPLSSIVLQTTLLRRPEMELNSRARSSGEAIERAATRMNRLIQDLLDTQRMESGPLTIEPARMTAAQLVLDAEEAHKALVASGSLELRIEVAPDLPDILGDRERLLQALENLLGNAIKFTPAGGRITIGARPREGAVVFWVEDTGPGIPEADVPRLFDRFWQARKGGRRGVGLGLPIVKAIVEAHGGRNWVDSVPGRGSTFCFTVPVA